MSFEIFLLFTIYFLFYYFIIYLIENSYRNPDGDSKPWCYVNNDDDDYWEYCDIPECSDIDGSDIDGE